MGSWGTGIFQDDFAADVAGLYKELLALGFPDEQIQAEIDAEFGAAEGIDASTLAIVLALLQHKHGRLTNEIRDRAVAVIESGQALSDWIELTEPGDPSIKSRAKQLDKARATIMSPVPRRKILRPTKDLRDRIDRTFQHFPWQADHRYAYRSSTGLWYAFSASNVEPTKGRRHYAKQGKQYVMVEPPELFCVYLVLLDFSGPEPPTAAQARELAPYLKPMSAFEKDDCLEAVESIIAIYKSGADRSFAEFELESRAMLSALTDEQFRQRYDEYVDFCRTQLARYEDREQAVRRQRFERYMFGPSSAVPEDRLINLGAAEHVECENVCVSITWETLDDRLESIRLSRQD